MLWRNLQIWYAYSSPPSLLYGSTSRCTTASPARSGRGRELATDVVVGIWREERETPNLTFLSPIWSTMTRWKICWSINFLSDTLFLGWSSCWSCSKAIRNTLMCHSARRAQLGDSTPRLCFSLLHEERGTNYCYRYLARICMFGPTTFMPRATGKGEGEREESIRPKEAASTATEELNRDGSLPLRAAARELVDPPSSLHRQSPSSSLDPPMAHQWRRDAGIGRQNQRREGRAAALDGARLDSGASSLVSMSHRRIHRIGDRGGGGVGRSSRRRRPEPLWGPRQPQSVLAAEALLDPRRQKLEVGNAAVAKLDIQPFPCPVVRA